MNTLLVLMAVLGFSGLGLWAFATSTPAQIAGAMRWLAPIGLGLFGGLLTAIGRVGLGFPLLAFAFAMWARNRRVARASPSPNQRSVVRTASLEMELDHDTGEMNGMVLDGSFEGRELNVLEEEQLFELAAEIQSDNESVELLNAYLDRRIPGWRDDMDADASPGKGRSGQSGPMTEQEAYQILGLDTGATVADVRKAHRRLMQGVHPDVGGSSFLAARINEAKDILLRAHEK
ncbi:MAG: DnaJ domain-containing protein [Pseudomonadota bacterium]